MVICETRQRESDGTVSFRFYVQGHHEEKSLCVWVLGCFLETYKGGRELQYDRIVGTFGKQTAWLALMDEQREKYREELIQDVTSMMLEEEQGGKHDTLCE